MLVITAKIAGFLLLFLLATGKLFNACLVQGADHYVAGDSHIIFPTEEVLIITRAENKIRGRKIMYGHKYNSRKIEMTKKEIGTNTAIRAKESRKYSRILISKEDYQGRFVAFNADYKGPRHHPPKNN